jgi:hypothetical protein
VLLSLVIWGATQLGRTAGTAAADAAGVDTAPDDAPRSWWQQLLDALLGGWWGVPLAVPLLLALGVVAFALRGPAILGAVTGLTRVVLALPLALLGVLERLARPLLGSRR